ncbi:rho GTPase-activating protein 20 [Suncus etruscus]|uniref:rho GTPase-activating protein 20 n=1 Tax=Suncus etruscus TaxID=109475 RepID=UPI00210F2CCC|nr:rho GTPase-activating protein 20 [Suncus etruscus]
MAAMSPQQETTLGGPQPGRSITLAREASRTAAGFLSAQKMKVASKSEPSIHTESWPMVSPSASRDLATISSLDSADRTLLIEGHVELKKELERQERHLFLYNDLLVVAKIKYNNNFKIKYKIKLCDMWMTNCTNEAGEHNINMTKSFIIGWPVVNFIVTFCSAEQKDSWFSLLKRFIAIEKEKDFPVTIPLKVDFLETGNGVNTKTLSVKNSETAKEIIYLALTAVGINSSDSEYQLWVTSGREPAPYALIGHEYPYSIKMNHIRDSIVTQGLKGTPINSLQEFLHMEPVPQEMRCQFTIKPSRLDALVPVTDSAQKPQKRRRSLINWNFWRGSETHLDNIPTVSSPGKLFGISLPLICENDSLPTPIVDMFVLLYERGPLTEGIFRKSASIKDSRELRDKLNSGADIKFDSESLFVVASVFKEFLRSIPESVFSCQLYEEWVHVLDEETKEEQIRKAHGLLGQLPRANIIFLSYLFSVLYCIEQNSPINQMNAFNLSVCIAPSLLWPPLSIELGTEVTKKVSQLTQFLIENACQVFGEEIFALFGEVSGTYNRKEYIPDSQMDSSYNGLDKELEDDYYIDAPKHNVLKGVDSRSLASILTYNDDCNVDTPETSFMTVSNSSLPYSREDLNMDVPFKERSSTPDVSSKLPSVISAFTIEKQCAMHQRHNSEPVLDRNHSLEGKVLPESFTDSALASPVFIENTPLGNHVGSFSEGNLIKPEDRHVALSIETTSMGLGTATDNAAPTGIRLRRCSEPTAHNFSMKFSNLKLFYRKKMRKSNDDMTLSPPQQTEKLEPKQRTGLRAKKSIFTLHRRKKDLTTNQKHSPKPDDYQWIVGHAGNQPTASDLPGCSSAPTKTAFHGSKRHRHSSEPTRDDEGHPCRMACLESTYSKKVQPVNGDTKLSRKEEDCLKRHKSLQMEGQKLINQSVIMGIQVGKSTMNPKAKVLPSSLNSSPIDSSLSSFSSVDTSPLGSSFSTCSQTSQHSVLNTTEAACPIEPTLQASEDLLVYNTSHELDMTIHSSGQARTHLTLHPTMWLRNGLSSLKSWSLHKARSSRPVEKTSSVRETMKLPPLNPGSPESSPVEETIEGHNFSEHQKKAHQEEGNSEASYDGIVTQERSPICLMTPTASEDKFQSQDLVPQQGM